eukprot:342345-Prymnesium_polylepis.1
MRQIDTMTKKSMCKVSAGRLALDSCMHCHPSKPSSVTLTRNSNEAHTDSPKAVSVFSHASPSSVSIKPRPER